MPQAFADYAASQPHRPVASLLDDAMPARVMTLRTRFSRADVLERHGPLAQYHEPGYQLPETCQAIDAGTWRELATAIAGMPIDEYSHAYSLYPTGIEIEGRTAWISCDT